MKSSVWMALIAIFSVSLWLFSGRFIGRQPAAQQSPPASVPVMAVSVMDSKALSIKREIVVQGRLEVIRKVDLRAETAGMVQTIMIEKGAQVNEGRVLLKLQEKDRAAQIAKADADIASKRLVVNAMQRLKNRGLQAETNLKQAQADLAAVQAEKLRLHLDLSETAIRAPFDGIVENRDVEQGSYVEVGDNIATIIDISRLKAVAYVAQQHSTWLQLQQPVLISLLDGREVKGALSFIGKEADTATRSFRVEAEFDNPGYEFAAGASAELHIFVGEMLAHSVSAAALSLDTQGRLGVKTLSPDNRVMFNPVIRVKADSNGIWVTGLPERARIIGLGQGFMLPGEIVNPVYR